MVLWFKYQVKILKLVVWVVTQIFLTCLDVGNSCLAPWLLKVCRWHQLFRIDGMTFDLTFKVKCSKYGMSI